MNIVFDKNICLFKNKTDAQIIQSIPQYKKYYKPKFSTFINELNFNENDIAQIHIIHNKSSYGTTTPIIKDNKLQFVIELSDEILVYISDIQNSLETFKSKSVFQHEISHCIEIKTLFDKNVLNVPKLFNENIHINTTYNFIYSEAVNIWSEFFACYNNRKYNEWHEVPNGEEDIIQLLKWIDALKYELNTHDDVKLPEEMLKFLHKFWYNMVSMIAIHLHNNEDTIITDYINSDNECIKIYFQYIYATFKDYNNLYPQWINESHYIEIGKSLMKILEINDITYSTSDLSDNFVFISM